MNGEISVADLIGSFRVRDKQMVFQYGAISRCVRDGIVCLADDVRITQKNP